MIDTPNAAPSLVTALVRDAAADQLETHWSEIVFAPALVGLALPFSVGTPRALESVTGLGSKILTFGLSGALSRGDVAAFQIQPGNAIVDASGQPAPTQQIVVDNQVGGVAPPDDHANPRRITHTSSAAVLFPLQVALVDVSGGAPPSITTPATPADGDPIWVVDAVGSFASTSCTVTANSGQTIEDPNAPGTFGATAVLSLAGAWVQWVYDAAQRRWKLGGCFYPTGGSGTVPVVAFANPITMTATSTSHVTSGSGALILEHDASGALDGVQRIITIDPSTYTSVVYPASLNVAESAPLDPTRTYLLTLEQVGSRVRGAAGPVSASLAAPTCTSLTVGTATPTHLVAVFDQLVTLTNLTGLTLVMSVGGARTISSVTGQGTNTLTFVSSVAWVAGDVGVLRAAAGQSIRGLDSNAFANGDTAVTNNVVAADLDSLPGLLQWFDLKSANVTRVGGNATVLSDISGHGHHATAGGSNVAAWTASDAIFSSNPSLDCNTAATVLYTVTSLPVSGGFTLHQVIHFPLSGSVQVFLQGSGGSTPNILAITNLGAYSGSFQDSGYALSSISSGVHLLTAVVTAGGSCQFYVDNVPHGSAVSVGSLATPATNLFGDGASQALGAKLALHAVYDHDQTSGDRTSAYNIIKAKGLGVP